MYEHLSRMSFSFYDRVQSGSSSRAQLRHPLGADVPHVRAVDPRAVQRRVLAFAEMLSINVPLALVTMSTMPFVYIVGVRMRKQMFPVSWLIQSRLADVATVVDENINGVRVVKSFAARTCSCSTSPVRRCAPSGRT
jgi:ABC-type multidrug transport system, ATPase and permease components